MIPEGFCQAIVGQRIDYSSTTDNRHPIQEAWVIQQLNERAEDGWEYCTQHDFFNRLYDANPPPESCTTIHQKQEFRRNLLHPLLRESNFTPKEFTSKRNVGGKWGVNHQCEPSNNALADIVGYRVEDLTSSCILPSIIDVKVYGTTNAGNGISILRLKNICENIIQTDGEDRYRHFYISIHENSEQIVETCTESDLLCIDVNGGQVSLNIAGGGGQLQIKSNPNQTFVGDQRAWAQYTLIPLYQSDLRKISTTMQKYLSFGDARNLRNSLMDVIESSSKWGQLDPTFRSSYSIDSVNGAHLARLNDDLFDLLIKLTFFDGAVSNGYNINEFIRLNLMLMESSYPVEFKWYEDNEYGLINFLRQLNSQPSQLLPSRWSSVITDVYSTAHQIQGLEGIENPIGLTPKNWGDRFQKLYDFLEGIIADLPEIDEF